MNNESKVLLEKIIGDYDAKLAEAERVDAANRAAHAAFPGRFAELRTKLIQPALQEIAGMLNTRGHETTVREQDESSTASGGVKSAAITLRVVPRPFAGRATEANSITVEVTFSANRNARKVTVSSTNTMIGHGGNVGKRGEYEIDAVTTDVVAGHVIQTLGEAFGNGGR